jgi:hypothetical protein
MCLYSSTLTAKNLKGDQCDNQYMQASNYPTEVSRNLNTRNELMGSMPTFSKYLFEAPAIEAVSQGLTLHTILSDGVAIVGPTLGRVLSAIAECVN